MGDFVVASFGRAFMTDVLNPLRHEALEGMALGVLYLGGAWLVAPAVAVWQRNRLSRFEAVASFVPLVFGLSVIGVVWAWG